MYTEKYNLASHCNLKIADSLFTDRETETWKGHTICQRHLYPQQIWKKTLKFPDWALYHNQSVLFFPICECWCFWTDMQKPLSEKTVILVVQGRQWRHAILSGKNIYQMKGVGMNFDFQCSIWEGSWAVLFYVFLINPHNFSPPPPTITLQTNGSSLNIQYLVIY